MPNFTSFHFLMRALLLAFLALTFSSQAFAALAARVEFALGNVTATSLDGQSRALAKGADVNSGDSINTGDGRIQLRFTDGAYLSLQPNTVLKIENYAFANKADGNEKAFFRLVKGALRTITGAIGKVNRQNYEMRTSTATIGIRGTAYHASHTEKGLTVSVAEGAVSVTNQAGSITVNAGRSAFVGSPQDMPALVTEKVALPKPEAPQSLIEQQTTGPGVIFNERLNEQGRPSVLDSGNSSAITPPISIGNPISPPTPIGPPTPNGPPISIGNPNGPP